jgi:hypothetical protein
MTTQIRNINRERENLKKKEEEEKHKGNTKTPTDAQNTAQKFNYEENKAMSHLQAPTTKIQHLNKR